MKNSKGKVTHWSAIKKCKTHGVYHRGGKCPKKNMIKPTQTPLASPLYKELLEYFLTSATDFQKFRAEELVKTKKYEEAVVYMHSIVRMMYKGKMTYKADITGV